MTKVLVCGGVHFSDVERLNLTLDQLHDERRFTALAQGGALGADRMAYMWAIKNGVRCVTYLADWLRYGKAAGPHRNGVMLASFEPNLVVAFPGRKGTADMVKKTQAAGVELIKVPE